MNKLLITTLKVSLFVFSLFFITSLASSVSAQSFSCETAYSGNSARISECQVLVDFYNSTGGTNWTSKTSWLTTRDYCTWYGMLCSDSGSASRVIALDLNHNNLSGQLPTSLGNLANLQRLYLYKNQLSGPIPTSLGNLTNLHELVLAANQLSGSIPASLGNLRQLTNLGLSDNNLDGAIPAELSGLIKIEDMHFETNKLSGEFPFGLASGNDVKYIYFQGQRDSQGQPPNTQICVSVRTRDVFNDIIRRGGRVLPDPAIPPICSGSNPTPTPGAVTWPSHCGCEATLKSIIPTSDCGNNTMQCTSPDPRTGLSFVSRMENGVCYQSQYYCPSGIPPAGNCGCSSVTTEDQTNYYPTEALCLGRQGVMAQCAKSASAQISGVRHQWQNGRCIAQRYSCSATPSLELTEFATLYMSMMQGRTADPRLDVNRDNAKDLRDFYALWRQKRGG